MSLKAITPPLEQTGPLAEIAKKETSNKKLLVAGITLLVISLIGFLVGLGLVIGGLTCGLSFVIAGASIIGATLLGIGIAALLLRLSKYRPGQFFKEPSLILEEKLLVSSKEEELKSQRDVLKARLQELDRMRDEEQDDWDKRTFEVRIKVNKLNKTLENIVFERRQENSENVRHLSAIKDLKQKNISLKSNNKALVTENEGLKSENELLGEKNDCAEKAIREYVQEQEKIKKIKEGKVPEDSRFSFKPLFDSTWLVK